MPASEHEAPQPLSMRDLLASCAAATAVSTPPREPQEGETPPEGHEHTERREAA
ncbi:hypothetical protein [Streptomyces enissocaesilis]|uniref:Uncharacterized protein n=1 Tax=Streptomyces enissocaesilis TaxID=332589 RepID=A0ABN3X773_9ACTN